MHKKLRYLVYIFFFTVYAQANASNFELYNAQSYPIYYAIQKTKKAVCEQELQQLPAYSYADKQLEANTIQLIVVKELPVAHQQIPVTIFEPQKTETNIYVKTHESHDGLLNIIPQSENPLQPAQTAGGLELKNCITPYEIWKTTRIYTPPHKELQQEVAEIQKEPEDMLSSSHNEPESYTQSSELTTDTTVTYSTTKEMQPKELTSDNETETTSEKTSSI